MTNDAKDILEFSVGYVTKFGYLGVAFLFLAMAYFLRSLEPRVKYILFSTGFAFLLCYGILEFMAQWFPDRLIARSVITGRIVNVRQNQAIRLSVGDKRAPGPYIRRENDPDKIELARYFFISSTQFDYQCMTLSVGGPVPEPSLFYIPINAVDASIERELVITIKDGPSSTQEATLAHYDGLRQPKHPEEALKQVPLAASSCEEIDAAARPPRTFAHVFDFVVPAEAQVNRDEGKRQIPQNLSYDDFENILRSDDPFVRREARTALSQQGSAAIPTITKLMSQSDYRLQIGALVALGQLMDLSKIALPADLLATVERLSVVPDPTMRNSAKKVIDAVARPSTISQGQIGIMLTCKNCPDSLDLSNIVHDVGVSVSAVEKEPPAEPSTYIKVDVDPSRAVQWFAIDLPATPAKVRLTIPDADSAVHPNKGIGNNGRTQQLDFQMSSGDKMLARLDLRPEWWYVLQRPWLGYGRVLVERFTASPPS